MLEKLRFHRTLKEQILFLSLRLCSEKAPQIICCVYMVAGVKYGFRYILLRLTPRGMKHQLSLVQVLAWGNTSRVCDVDKLRSCCFSAVWFAGDLFITLRVSVTECSLKHACGPGSSSLP